MRNGQNKRMRGRNRGGKSHNPLTRVYESNGPDIKIRGTASHIAEKYVQLARDAQSSGDPVSAENYYQHAEHYFRLIAAAQEQFRQTQPYFRAEGEARDEAFDDGDEENQNYPGGEPGYGREPQPYLPRDAQPFPPREQNYQPREQRPQQNQAQAQPQVDAQPELPSFITGAQPQSAQANGHEGGGGNDRFPLHRRRRRHRGPRSDAPQGAADAPAGE
jgi:hypothetical protein